MTPSLSSLSPTALTPAAGKENSRGKESTMSKDSAWRSAAAKKAAITKRARKAALARFRTPTGKIRYAGYDSTEHQVQWASK